MTAGGCGPGGCRCGCCAGLERETPVPIGNRPGLDEIGYRVGTYHRFHRSMVAGLTRSDRPALADLRTRDPGDLTLALLDAWAVTADVLTFYTERAANEHYLGTATERRSVAAITGLIGYRLGPGTAAATTLAFTVDPAPGNPTRVPVAVGTRVQTLPGPDEVPQTWETVGALDALTAWNLLPVRSTRARPPRRSDTGVVLAGSTTGLSPGDALVFTTSPVIDGTFDLVRVTAVAADQSAGTTEITFAPALGHDDYQRGRIVVLRRRASLFGYNAPSPALFSAEVKRALGDLLTTDDREWNFAVMPVDQVDLDSIDDRITVGATVVVTGVGEPQRATVAAVDDASRTAYGVSAKVTRLELTTGDPAPTLGGDATRSTVLLVGDEVLTPAEVPLHSPVRGSRIALVPGSVPTPESGLPRPVLVVGRAARLRLSDSSRAGIDVHAVDGGVTKLGPLDDAVVLAVTDLASGERRLRLRTVGDRVVTVTGPAGRFSWGPARPDDPVVGEQAMVAAVVDDHLELEAPLVNVYDRHEVAGRTVEVWGNVAPATHGETVTDEILGSGDATARFPRFALRHGPLTHLVTAAGATSTLVVRVDGVAWREVPSLYGTGPRDQVFTTTTTDRGVTVVVFGDGTTGARLPTGRDNVTATYRFGAGLAGQAAAGQLSLLLTRPLGIRAVVNPLAATGASDPEVTADAAANAPRTVLTLDRVVSLRDHEDHAATFPGIGKAGATWTWDGTRRGVAVSVAGIGGTELATSDPLLADLRASLGRAGDPMVPLVVVPAVVRPFQLSGTVVIDPAHDAATVVEAVVAALVDRFSFVRRSFGQLVALSEIDEVVHTVPGVRGLLVTQLYRADDEPLRNEVLVARALTSGGPPPLVGGTGAEVLVTGRGNLALEATS